MYFKIYFLIVCLCGAMYMCVQVPTSGYDRLLEAVPTGSWEPTTDVGAGNQAEVL